MHSSPEEQSHLAVSRFESMLSTNNVLFFVSSEFETIIQHYLENGKISLAKKAVRLGLEQHPSATNLQLFQVEIHIFENELDTAEELLDGLYALEQSNEEIYIQKANICSRRDNHQEAINLLQKALEVTDDHADILSLIGMEFLFMEDFEKPIRIHPTASLRGRFRRLFCTL